VEPGVREEIVHGRCEGTLALEPRGDGGFGYDPAFVPDDYPGDERTMAELSPLEKDAISHRGRAARALVLRLLKAEEAARPAGPLRSLLGGLGERRGRGDTR
jgi:non-canonical purine NTP pyrophosphatase (RdgB/HAM1 family)